MQVMLRCFLCILFLVNLDVHEFYVAAVNQFRAAVFEHAVIQHPDRSKILTRQEALNVMMKNLHVYKEQAVKASAMKAEIIVFPEYGLYGLNWTRQSILPYLEHIPKVNTPKWNPCEVPMMYPSTEVQRNISCFAKEAAIYVVANMGAREPCDITDPNCPQDLHRQFSANVVYGPNGDFIARYFKYNLYPTENYFDKPKGPEMTTFDTPFGRFGTFTSADILYHDPALHLINTMNVTNIVYPTAWQDDLPLMAAIEFHSAFAEGTLINLLAANLHLTSLGYHGSGLYWPTGTSINASYYYNAQSNSKGALVVDNMTPFIIPPKTSRFSNPEFHNIHQKFGFETVETDIHKQTTDQNPLRREDAFKDNMDIAINNDIYTAVLLRESSGGPTVCHVKLCCSADYEGSFYKH